ncbi:hypothetical protein IWQ60_003897 [Tieghemiomyces parasiticus]|uniref:GRAM domain-containing protein n=1 Tax=Tieghemiomyces parasiticus TaxID=78921 RepID=A0A9W8A9E4_9FUNG|nr:hypothetical protein IWQ60_003897 [Tieghemiomyces parasiticus]
MGDPKPPTSIQYRRLHSQVSEVEAVPVKLSESVCTDAFCDDQGRVDYGGYVTAVLRHYVHLYAADKVDRQDPANSDFHLTQFLTSVDRLSEVAEPYRRLGNWAFRVATWTSFYESAFWCLAFIIYFLTIIIRHGLNPSLEIGFGSPSHDPSESTESHPKLGRAKHHGTQLSKRGKAKLVTELWGLWKTRMGYVVHREMKDRTEILEKVRNAVKWRQPRATLYVVSVMACYLVSLTVLPLSFGLRYAGFCLGLEVFLLFNLRVRFPRYRRLFSILNWHVWPVPDDATYAMQVLRQSSVPLRRPNSTVTMSESPSVPTTAPAGTYLTLSTLNPFSATNLSLRKSTSRTALNNPITENSAAAAGIDGQGGFPLPIARSAVRNERSASWASPSPPLLPAHHRRFPSSNIKLLSDEEEKEGNAHPTRTRLTQSRLARPFHKVKDGVQRGAEQIRRLSHRASKLNISTPDPSPNDKLIPPNELLLPQTAAQLAPTRLGGYGGGPAFSDDDLAPGGFRRRMSQSVGCLDFPLDQDLPPMLIVPDSTPPATLNKRASATSMPGPPCVPLPPLPSLEVQRHSPDLNTSEVYHSAPPLSPDSSLITACSPQETADRQTRNSLGARSVGSTGSSASFFGGDPVGSLARGLPSAIDSKWSSPKIGTALLPDNAFPTNLGQGPSDYEDDDNDGGNCSSIDEEGESDEEDGEEVTFPSARGPIAAGASQALLTDDYPDGTLEFRCLYKGVPGYLVIDQATLTFRKSRVLGAHTGDPVPLDWVVGVRKSSSHNLLMYRSPGLVIKLSNKQCMGFKNVARRDEAFHALIVRCRKQWQHV